MAEKNNYKYKKQYNQAADKYIASKKDSIVKGKLKVNLPTIDEFAVTLGVTKQTVHNWGKDHKSFRAALDRIKTAQKQRLLSESLAGNYNPTIAKLILSSDHGMRERTDITTDNEPITPFSDEQTDRIAERIASRKTATGDNAGK